MLQTILNVDDNAASRYARSRIFERAGYGVTEAATGTEALRLAQEIPGIILLDVNLPDLSGLEVCRIIKSDPATASIPVLHLSASALEDKDRVRGLDGGADSYLTEPIEPEVLLATVRALLRARKAEEALRLAVREWHTTFEAISDGLALVNREGWIVRCNQALSGILDQSGDRIIGRACDEVLTEAFGSMPDDAFLRTLKTGKRERIELQIGRRWIDISSDPVGADGGALSGVVWRLADITERKRLEEQLRQSQKAESVGLLAGGVAHDFNNLLTGIIGNTSLALSEVAPDDPIRSHLEDVMVAGEKAADLTKQLLAYSGRGRYVIRKVDLSRLVIETGKLLEASVPKKIDVRLALEPNLPLIEADPDQMRQLILNLVVNAGEAIGDATGTILIRTGSESLQETSEGLGAGKYAVLEVQDSGAGMDEPTRTRIFEPFFSTKFVGRGMGLAAAMGIVSSHKGCIRVHSTLGEGSIFTVLFPVVREAVRSSETTQDLTGAATVLVVDDEEVVRQTAKMALQHYGHNVLLAENGQQALDVIRQHRNEISLVILDMTMPVMSGEEAFQHIEEMAPQLPVIASTGYTKAEAIQRFSGKRVVGFIQKPYTAVQLGRAVKAAMEKPSPK